VVIPIEKAFLYVEPVYLLAEGVNIPQLIRVIVISGNKVVMEPTLDQAIHAVFGAAQPTEQKAGVPSALEAQIVERARKELDKAQEAMQSGRWEDFGKAMQGLKETLTPAPRP
jgi:uncharacterized membrane protein (UPF0182 family)